VSHDIDDDVSNATMMSFLTGELSRLSAAHAASLWSGPVPESCWTEPSGRMNPPDVPPCPT
jgi:hypothetical protein